jgi:Ser/Thr protein kinase RdoA (MazF antagonist)
MLYEPGLGTLPFERDRLASDEPNVWLPAPLNSYENRVYQFQDEDRQRFVVKFYRPQRWTSAQIQEEHQFALDLLADDVPVAAPLTFSGQTLLTHQGFSFAVFPSLGGRQFEADNIDQMEWVARYLGRIHQTGQKKAFKVRPTIGVQDEKTAWADKRYKLVFR